MGILIRMNQQDGGCLIEIDSDNIEAMKIDGLQATEQEADTRTADNQVSTELKHESTLQKQRELDTFMRKSYQYLRMGDIYLKAAPNNNISFISRSCYYSNRKKAGYGQK